MLAEDKQHVSALRTLAQAMDDLSGGCGKNTAGRLRAAADRIVQLAQDRTDALRAWYRGESMCAKCVHQCANTDAYDCTECDRDCMCPTCQGENWEEANSDG